MSTNMKQQGASLVIVAIFLSCIHLVISEQWCDASELEQCSSSESCVIDPLPSRDSKTQHLNGTCHCLKDYQRASNGDCVRVANLGPGYAPLQGHSTTAASVAAGVLVPLTIIIAVAASIYFGRKYNWLERIRQPPVRQYDTVLIGSQMDGDDDPPIS